MMWLALGIVLGGIAAIAAALLVLPRLLRFAVRQTLPSFSFSESVPEHEAVPVVMYHVVHRRWFESEIKWLADNGYETITPDLLVDWLEGKPVQLPRRPIVLTFDDAHRSIYTDAFPILRDHKMTGVTFVCPWWIKDSREPNAPQISDWHAHPLGDCATWGELREMHDASVIHPEAHSLAHQQIWVDGTVRGFIRPVEPCRYVSFGNPDAPPTTPNPPIGWPILTHCSRFSARQRFIPDESFMQRCAEHVEHNGGASFFSRPTWKTDLYRVIDPQYEPGKLVTIAGRHETPEEQRAAIAADLQQTRDMLKDKLGVDARHLCCPWNVGSAIATEVARDVGYRSIFRGMLNARDVNRIGDDPMHIVRFKSHEPQQTVRCLPGKGRFGIASMLAHTTIHGLRRRFNRSR